MKFSRGWESGEAISPDFGQGRGIGSQIPLVVARGNQIWKLENKPRTQTVVTSRQTTPTSQLRHFLLSSFGLFAVHSSQLYFCFTDLTCRKAVRTLFTPVVDSGGNTINELTKWLTQTQEHLQYLLLVCKK